MKLSNLGEVNDFLQTVDRCTGEVWLEDGEGSRLNLRSKLSQYVAIGALVSNHGTDLELFCELPEDAAKFYVLLSEHPNMDLS